MDIKLSDFLIKSPCEFTEEEFEYYDSKIVQITGLYIDYLITHNSPNNFLNSNRIVLINYDITEFLYSACEKLC